MLSWERRESVGFIEQWCHQHTHLSSADVNRRVPKAIHTAALYQRCAHHDNFTPLSVHNSVSRLRTDNNNNNNNTNICNAHSVSKHTESEAQAVARWGGWREWSVKCYLNRYVLRWRLKVGRVEQSLISRVCCSKLAVLRLSLDAHPA